MKKNAGKLALVALVALAAFAAVSCSTPGPVVSLKPSSPLEGKSFLVAEVSFVPRQLPIMPIFDAAAFATGADGIKKQVAEAEVATAAALTDSVSEAVAGHFKGSVAKAPNPFAADGVLDWEKLSKPDEAAKKAIADLLASSGADIYLVAAPCVITDTPGFLGLNGRSHLAIAIRLFDAEGKLVGKGDTYTEQLVTSAGDVGQYKAVLAFATGAAAKLIAKF